MLGLLEMRRGGGDQLKFDILFYPNRIAIITLFGELDHHGTEKIRKHLTHAILQGELQTIIWNFEHLQFMDSSGIGLVLGRLKELRAVDGRILIINPNPTMEKIFQFSGLTPFIFKGTEIEALHFAGGKIYG